MTIDISTQQMLVTLVLGALIWIGNKYGDSGSKSAGLFFLGGMAGILLICYWMYHLLMWVARVA